MTSEPPHEPSTHKPLNWEDVRKLLDSKLVSTGVPGIIVGVAITRAIDGNWAQAVQALGVAAGVWMLLKLGNRLAPKIERVVDQADQTFDQRLDLTLSNLTGFHRQYLEALRTHCYNLRVEGYKGRLPRLALENVYVPLRVSLDNQRKTAQLSGGQTIWKLLPKAHHPNQTFPYRLMAIIADPGYGKTTLMRFLTLSFANQTYTTHKAKELIPVLLLFRDIHPQIQAKNLPSLPQLIVEDVRGLPCCEELRASEPWFKDQLKQGKCLIMLDGLDEVPDAKRELVSQWANWQMQNYPTQFIVTSRPHGFDRSLFEGVQRIDILDFNSDQKRTFIEQWYRFITWELTWKRHWDDSQYNPEPQKRLTREQAEAESDANAQKAADALNQRLFADQSLTDLAKNPLLITIIAATYEANESLPSQRSYLYREIFKLLLEYRPNRRDTRLTISNAEDNQLILQKLALELMEAGQTQFSTQQGVDWIKDRFAEISKGNSLTPKAFLQEIEQISGLLGGGEGELYEFTHKTFQEYSTAKELNSRWGSHKIREKFADSNWEEVVYFFAVESAIESNSLIELALNNPTNLYTLELARRLANDNPQVDKTLRQAVLDELQKQEPASAEVRLEQRFRNLISLSETTAISDCITWGEYRLFLESQASGQFHSQAAIYSILEAQETYPVTDITWEDTRWFCAWLSTQSYLTPEDGVYDYRLPTPDENQHAPLEKGGAAGGGIYAEPQTPHRSPLNPPLKRGEAELLQPWTTDSTQSGNALRVVRQRIPDRYSNLVSYLANGQWKEADQETDRMMLEAVGKEAVGRGYLKLEDIRDFPCADLHIIDQLWIKFSGGKFGFSVQKQIWIEVGGKLDFGEDFKSAKKAYEAMSDRNGWRRNNDYISYTKVTFDTSAPQGHLPYTAIGDGGGRFWGLRGGVELGCGYFFSRIASRLVNCSR
jgi:hypothetical protein